MQHPYFGKTISLTTKHKKASALALPLLAGVGLRVREIEVDTDIFGTFSGEIERKGTPLETALKKARLGMRKGSSELGLATEGSFGAHPYIPFIAGCEETIVLIDDVNGFHLSETIISAKTNFSFCEVRKLEDAESFLRQAKFPSHGLIVKPNQLGIKFIHRLGRLLGNYQSSTIKGIQDRCSLKLAIDKCAALSNDGLARVETDMRAYMNPTRLRVIRELGVKLARRLRSSCTECGCPGFGQTTVSGFLNCSECGCTSESPSHEIHSCARCEYSKTVPRSDGVTSLDPMYCQRCNP